MKKPKPKRHRHAYLDGKCLCGYERRDKPKRKPRTQLVNVHDDATGLYLYKQRVPYNSKPAKIQRANDKAKKRKPSTWGSIFRNAVARGDDHGYAAFLADAWERRMLRKKLAGACVDGEFVEAK